MNIIIPDDLQWLGEKFTPGMAWVDLQILGEARPSIRHLAVRWKWSNDRVVRFLAKAEHLSLQVQQQVQEQVHQQVQNDTSKSIGCEESEYTDKYTDKYTHKYKKELPPDSPSPDPTLPFPSETPHTHTPVTTPPITPQEATEIAHTRKTMDERMEDFRREVYAFSSKWEASLLDEFFSYWSESNPGGVKMRFEMEKIFDLSRRLARWDKNCTDKGRPSRAIKTKQQPKNILLRKSPEEIAKDAFAKHQTIIRNVRQAIDIIWNGSIPKERIDAALVAAGYDLSQE